MKRIVAGLAGAALILTTTTACGGDEVAERATEEAIEQLAESEGVEVDIDADGGEVSIETDEGTITTGQDLPEGFPVDDVPLIDAEVVSGLGQAGAQEGWVVTMQSDASAEDAYADAVALLEDAGFAVEAELTATQGGYTSDAWTVFLVADDSAGSTTITYAVSGLT